MPPDEALPMLLLDGPVTYGAVCELELRHTNRYVNGSMADGRDEAKRETREALITAAREELEWEKQQKKSTPAREARGVSQ